MTPDQFCYWLQGYFELKKTIDCREGATPETMQAIEDHLQLVFEKKTPLAKGPAHDLLLRPEHAGKLPQYWPQGPMPVITC